MLVTLPLYVREKKKRNNFIEKLNQRCLQLVLIYKSTKKQLSVASIRLH